MPDIAMCLGTDCPKKESCVRFTSKPNPHRQSYFSKPPIEGGKCDHFWKNRLDADIDNKFM